MTLHQRIYTAFRGLQFQNIVVGWLANVLPREAVALALFIYTLSWLGQQGDERLRLVLHGVAATSVGLVAALPSVQPWGILVAIVLTVDVVVSSRRSANQGAIVQSVSLALVAVTASLPALLGPSFAFARGVAIALLVLLVGVWSLAFLMAAFPAGIHYGVVMIAIGWFACSAALLFHPVLRNWLPPDGGLLCLGFGVLTVTVGVVSRRGANLTRFLLPVILAAIGGGVGLASMTAGASPSAAAIGALTGFLLNAVVRGRANRIRLSAILMAATIIALAYRFIDEGSWPGATLWVFVAAAMTWLSVALIRMPSSAVLAWRPLTS